MDQYGWGQPRGSLPEGYGYTGWSDTPRDQAYSAPPQQQDPRQSWGDWLTDKVGGGMMNYGQAIGGIPGSLQHGVTGNTYMAQLLKMLGY